MIVSREGHILTNAHVIHDDYEVSDPVFVSLHDGGVEEAKILGYDHHSDIALLKIDAEQPLSAAKIGDSDNLRTGDAVLAIGHPEGYYYSLSTGVVSSVDRFDIGPNTVPAPCVVPWIQTDAVINSGNSGGPLLNDDGELVGIISWSDAELYDSGLNFAVPINIAMFIHDVLLDQGAVPWGIMGVYVDYGVAATATGYDVEGLRVNQVNKGSGAEAAGILAGDLIIEYDGLPIYEIYFGCALEGTEIPITLLRDGKEISLSVTLGAIEGVGFLR